VFLFVFLSVFENKDEDENEDENEDEDEDEGSALLNGIRTMRDGIAQACVNDVISTYRSGNLSASAWYCCLSQLWACRPVTDAKNRL